MVVRFCFFCFKNVTPLLSDFIKLWQKEQEAIQLSKKGDGNGAEECDADEGAEGGIGAE